MIYLEILVIEKKVSESRFHTKLGCTYIDNLFKFVPRDEDPKKAFEKLNESGQKLYAKFESFYKNPELSYDPTFLLEKVKRSWLVREEIYFYGKVRFPHLLNLLLSIIEYLSFFYHE